MQKYKITHILLHTAAPKRTQTTYVVTLLLLLNWQKILFHHKEMFEEKTEYHMWGMNLLVQYHKKGSW